MQIAESPMVTRATRTLKARTLFHSGMTASDIVI